MITLHGAGELRRHVAAWRGAGESIAFVPTMGALHEGHLSLVDRARELCDRVVASIFVNPTQFAPTEDLGTYPRTPEQDSRWLDQRGCDLLFLPTPEIIYPQGCSTWVDVAGAPAEGLESGHRPGHFKGVATVVTILFNLVQPDVAVFGQKDAQQLAVVRRMVRDLHLPVRIVAGPTVRDEDGLALSSRNAYLSADERQVATVLSRALSAARQTVEGGERDADVVRRVLAECFAEEAGCEVDYAEIVDADSFRPVERIEGPVVLPVAARVGATRLIDNIFIHPDPETEP